MINVHAILFIGVDGLNILSIRIVYCRCTTIPKCTGLMKVNLTVIQRPSVNESN